MNSILFLFYNLAYFFFALVYLPHFLLRARQEENVSRLIKERLGWVKNSTSRGRTLWIHAVSVGEVLAIEPFIQKIREHCPEFFILLTTVTPTGQKIAKRLEGEGVQVAYFPFDWTFSVKSFIRRFQPSCLLLAETEVWPNLIWEMHLASIPVLILNGRLSEKSAKRYQMFSFFFQSLFQSLTAVFAQTESDANRFRFAGVCPEKVTVAGSMKFDSPYLSEISENAKRFERKWKIRRDFFWIAGSTHPGEDEILIRVFKELKPSFPQLQLMIAPRHIERSEAILKRVEEAGLRGRLSTAEPEDYDVLILNEMGTLAQLYALAEMVFMGGSLVPKGGQNPIEPASFECAILYGPHIFNFQNTYQFLISEKAALMVSSDAELKEQIRQLLQNPAQRRDLGKNAFQVVQRFRGSTEKQFQLFRKLIQSTRERKDHAECSEKLFSPSGRGL